MATTIKAGTGKTNAMSRAEGLSEGTTKHFTNASQVLTIGGVSYTVAQVSANLQEIVDLRNATTSAQASAKAAVAAEAAKLPPLLLFLAAYVAYVKATFGNSPTVLADFGVPTKKARKPLTTEQKAAASAKAKATRAARGTKGPVAIQEVTGNVIGVTVTPITTPEAPATAPATPPAAPANASTPAPAPALSVK
ncbi:MAG: hypothetical protein ABSE49_08270 [Polyangiaceae bacterium]|jgi:hypothetical protein